MTDGASTLIIDADDTLWENNIHFEEATERFLDLVETRGGEREPARARLVHIERKNIPVHGYGTGGFTRSLIDTLEEITGKRATASDRQSILALGARVRSMPIQYLPGVKETLPLLKRRHLAHPLHQGRQSGTKRQGRAQRCLVVLP